MRRLDLVWVSYGFGGGDFPLFALDDAPLAFRL